MTRGQHPGGPADPKTSLAFTIYPWSSHSVVTVDMARWDSTGRHVSRLAYWHLDLVRSQLHGRSTDDVLRLVCLGLLRRLESGAKDPADALARSHDNTAEGPGAPLGATGGTVTQDCPPGDWPTPGTPGGIDTV